MKILTIATKAEGYFNLLKQTAKRWGYDLQVLGWEQDWKGFAWKLELYAKALATQAADEPIICVDGYDVVAIAPAKEILGKFKNSKHRVIFSGQRYFPNQKYLQKLADQVMSNDLSKTISKKASTSKDYSRPCMGLLVGYAGDLLTIFQKLLEIETQRSTNDDQTLLNIYYLLYPNSIQLDSQCNLFQNLWRTRSGIYGKISPNDKSSEVEVIYDKNIHSKRIRNKYHQTMACFIHAPFNLDMGLLLKELHLEPPNANFDKAWSYWKYSIMHHIKRALQLYAPFITIILCIIFLIILACMINK